MIALALDIEAITAPVEVELSRIESLLKNDEVHLRALVSGVEPMVAACREEAPFHEGALKDNIRPVIVGARSVAIRTDLPYSWMRERGGIIRVKNAPRLHWFDYSGGEHFAIQVTQTGDYYMERGYEATRGVVPGFYMANLMAELGA